MIAFTVIHPVKAPQALMREALRAYYSLLGIAIGNHIPVIPEAVCAEVRRIDDDEESAFVHFYDRSGKIITSFELAYSTAGDWFVCDYCDGVDTGVTAFRKYAGNYIKFSDLKRMQDTLSHIVAVESRHVASSHHAKH